MWFLSALTWAPPQQKLIAAQLLMKRENENPRNRFYREKRRLPSKRCTGKPVKSRWEETTASQGVPPDPVSCRPAVEPTPQQTEQARQTHGQHRRRGRARAAGRARAPCQAAGGDEVELLRRRAKAAPPPAGGTSRCRGGRATTGSTCHGLWCTAAARGQLVGDSLCSGNQ
jgi:hypothetical protein